MQSSPTIGPENAGLVSTWIVWIALLMLILSFQINLIAGDQIKVIYDVVMASFIMILLVNNLTTRFVVVFVIFLCIGILFNDLLKWIYLSFSFYFGFLLISKYKERVTGFLIFIALLNFVIISLQLWGADEIFYRYQNYYDRQNNFVNLLFNDDDLSWAPLTQIRPSGIFPSTIYLSLFQFFITAYFFLNKEDVSKPFYFLLALSFALIGSTTSILLAICIYLFGERRLASRWFFCCFSVSIILYYILLPSFFFEYNYSFSDFMSSLESRLILDQSLNDDAISGTFLKHTLPFLMVALFASIYMLFAWNLALRKLIFICILIFAPLIVHNFLTSVFYWFYVGYIYGSIMPNRFDVPVKKHRGALRIAP